MQSLGHPGDCCCPDGSPSGCGWSINWHFFDVFSGDLIIPPPEITYQSAGPTSTGESAVVCFRFEREGFYPRCTCVEVTCESPPSSLDVSLDFYSKSDWVDRSCCGDCSPTAVGVRPPNMFKKTLFVSIDAPEAVIGPGPRTVTVNYDPGLSVPGEVLVYDSGCIASGGWGHTVDTFWCLRSVLESGECYDAYGHQEFDVIVQRAYTGKVHYASARCRVFIYDGGEAQSDGRQTVRTACPTWVSWQNYWQGGCPECAIVESCDPTPPHTVGEDSVPQDCNCGSTLPSGPDYWFPITPCTYSTRNFSILMHGDATPHPPVFEPVCAPVDASGDVRLRYITGGDPGCSSLYAAANLTE